MRRLFSFVFLCAASDGCKEEWGGRSNSNSVIESIRSVERTPSHVVKGAGEIPFQRRTLVEILVNQGDYKW